MAQDSTYFLFGLSYILTLLLSCFVIAAWVELRAMQKSTHKIQWVPMDAPFTELTEEQKKSGVDSELDNIL